MLYKIRFTYLDKVKLVRTMKSAFSYLMAAMELWVRSGGNRKMTIHYQQSGLTDLTSGSA